MLFLNLLIFLVCYIDFVFFSFCDAACMHGTRMICYVIFRLRQEQQ